MASRVLDDPAGTGLPGPSLQEPLSPTDPGANYSGLVSGASGDFCFLRERSSNAIKSARSSTSIAIPAKRDGEISSGGGGATVVPVVALGVGSCPCARKWGPVASGSACSVSASRIRCRFGLIRQERIQGLP